jgi:hypothetical protein
VQPGNCEGANMTTVTKRNFKEIGGSSVFRKWTEFKQGENFEGKYIGRGKIDAYGKRAFLFNVAFCSFDKSLEGKTLGLNEMGNLNSKMENVQEGDYVMISYEGKYKLEKGPFKGKESHTVKVLIAEEESAKADLSVSFDDEV